LSFGFKKQLKRIDKLKEKNGEKKYTMAGIGSEWLDSRLIRMVVIGLLLIAPVFVSAKESLEQEASNYNVKVLNISLWQPGRLGYQHVWPVSPTFVLCLLLHFNLLKFLPIGGEYRWKY